MRYALVYFPLVGAGLGLLLVGLDRALEPLVERPLRDFLLLAALVVATGGLHLDGLIDSADGLLGPGRRLGGASECAQHHGHGVARDLDGVVVGRSLLSNRERALERRQRLVVGALLVEPPAEIVEERSAPVGRCRLTFAELDPARRPGAERLVVRRRERRHVCRVAGEVVRARRGGLFEGRHDCTSSRGITERILQTFAGPEVQPHRLDSRIADVVQILRDAGADPPTPDELNPAFQERVTSPATLLTAATLIGADGSVTLAGFTLPNLVKYLRLPS